MANLKIQNLLRFVQVICLVGHFAPVAVQNTPVWSQYFRGNGVDDFIIESLLATERTRHLSKWSRQTQRKQRPQPTLFYPLTGLLFVSTISLTRSKRKGLEKMPRLTLKVAEETLRKEVHKLDKRVQLMAVNQTKKKDAYRVTLLKDGRTGSADIKKDLIRGYLAGEGKGKELRRALGKAVSHLSIRYRK